jgi:hypothetical protein
VLWVGVVWVVQLNLVVLRTAADSRKFVFAFSSFFANADCDREAGERSDRANDASEAERGEGARARG